MRSLGLVLCAIVECNLFDNQNVRTKIKKTAPVGRNNFGVSRLQCFYHPRWVNCRSRANIQLRAAPGKAIPMCVGGCTHGVCVKRCLFGSCHHQCECEDGWEGLRCNRDVNDCSRLDNGSRPCQHRCVNLQGKRRCMCEEGYELQQDARSCRRTKSLCELKGCELDCFERYGVAHCTCPKPGFKIGPDGRSCEDENECVSKGIGLCRTTEVCVNLQGGYRCDCGKGYIRNGQSPICTDIDECALEMHDCDRGATCRNIAGFYQCIQHNQVHHNKAEGATLRAPSVISTSKLDNTDQNYQAYYDEYDVSAENADYMKNAIYPYYD